MRLSEVQPEFKTPIWDYLGFLVDEQRVADGRAMMRQYDEILRAAERRFGVDHQCSVKSSRSPAVAILRVTRDRERFKLCSMGPINPSRYVGEASRPRAAARAFDRFD